MTDLRYLFHGAATSLAWFVVINAAASVAAVVIAKRAARGVARSAGFWLALRLMPAAVSLAFVAVLFVPSYWRYEPRAVEDVDISVTALAAAALIVAIAAARRGWLAWRRASRRAAHWRQVARPVSLDASTGIDEIPIDAPMMALVGIVRPRLLVTRGVVDALTADELRASVAHEIGHLRARDNLKRLAMRCAPDFLSDRRTAATIEQRWAAAAEAAADRAAGPDAETRCALASALVKVARLTPLSTPIAEPISTLVDGGDIAARVERLLDDNATADAGSPRTAAAIAVTLLAAFALAYAPLLRAVHAATEAIVNTLP